MGLFSRKPKNPSYIPEIYLRGLREYGEHLIGQPGGFNSALLADLDLIDLSQRDPEAYVELLAAHIGPDSGTYCLGAAEVIAVINGLSVSTSAWNRIVDGATGYLRSLGVPYDMAKPYMKVRWEKIHSPIEW